ERPSPFDADVKQDLDLLPLYKEVNNCFAWTQGAITTAGYFDWLSNLELEHRHTLPNGIRCLGVHASPGRDDGSGIHPKSTQQELQTLVNGCDADIVFVGHTHAPCDITVEGIRIVNLGSISNPIPEDLRASYVILESDRNSYKLSHHRVAYDYAAVIDQCNKINHPATRHITELMLGQHQPPWVRS
ncbi:MAG: metallophosphoesterase family protein, partial [Deinococcota bacterium]